MALPILPRPRKWQPKVTPHGLYGLCINRNYVTDENFDVIEVRDQPGSSSLRAVSDVTDNIDAPANQVTDSNVTIDDNQQGDCDVTSDNNQQAVCGVTSDSNEQVVCDATPDSNEQVVCDATPVSNEQVVCDATVIRPVPSAPPMPDIIESNIEPEYNPLFMINEASSMAHVEHIDRTRLCSNGNATPTAPNPPETDNTDDNVTPTEPILTQESDNMALPARDILASRVITAEDLSGLMRSSAAPSPRRPSFQAELAPRRSSVSSQGSRSGSTSSEHISSDNIPDVLVFYSTESRPARRSPITSRGHRDVNHQASPRSDELGHRHRSTSPSSATGATSPGRLTPSSPHNGRSENAAFLLQGVTSSSEPNSPCRSPLPRRSSTCSQSNVPSSSRDGGSPPVQHAENVYLEKAQMFFGEHAVSSEVCSSQQRSPRSCSSQQRSPRPSRSHRRSPPSVIPNPQCDTDSDDDVTSAPSMTAHRGSPREHHRRSPSTVTMVTPQRPSGNYSPPIVLSDDDMSVVWGPPRNAPRHRSPYTLTPHPPTESRRPRERYVSDPESRRPRERYVGHPDTSLMPSNQPSHRHETPFTGAFQAVDSRDHDTVSNINISSASSASERSPSSNRSSGHQLSPSTNDMSQGCRPRTRSADPTVRDTPLPSAPPMSEEPESEASLSDESDGQPPECCPRSPSHRGVDNPTAPSHHGQSPTSPTHQVQPPTSPSRRVQSPTPPSRRVQSPTSPSRRVQSPTSPTHQLQPPTSPTHQLQPPTSPSHHNVQRPLSPRNAGVSQVWRPRAQNTPPAAVMAPPPSYEEETAGLPSYEMAAKILEAKYKTDKTKVIINYYKLLYNRSLTIYSFF